MIIECSVPLIQTGLKAHTFTGTGWELFEVDLVRRTAFVWNGRWWLHWDEFDFYAKGQDGFLHWLFARDERELMEIEIELKRDLP